MREVSKLDQVSHRPVGVYGDIRAEDSGVADGGTGPCGEASACRDGAGNRGVGAQDVVDTEGCVATYDGSESHGKWLGGVGYPTIQRGTGRDVDIIEGHEGADRRLIPDEGARHSGDRRFKGGSLRNAGAIGRVLSVFAAIFIQIFGPSERGTNDYRTQDPKITHQISPRNVYLHLERGRPLHTCERCSHYHTTTILGIPQLEAGMGFTGVDLHHRSQRCCRSPPPSPATTETNGGRRTALLTQGQHR